MSFSANVRKMITSQEFDKASGLAILSGVIKSCGVLLINRDISFRIDDENNFAMQFLLKIIKLCYGFKPQIYVNDMNHFGKTYSLQVQEARNVLIDCGVLDEQGNLTLENKIPKKFLEDERLLRAFLKGVFLGGGSVNDPENSYHMELVLSSRSLADDIIEG